jgi:SAM-dependent methyltransferase
MNSIARRWLINPSLIRIRRLNRRFARSITPEMLVLDAGAGQAPYRKYYRRAQYETADFALLKTDYHPPTYVCDLADIPVEDARFDRVVFNQVLEHLPEPAVVLAELARVLKDDGRILCTCPFFYHLHQQPYDFYRYTQYGLSRLFEDAGFERVKVRWVEGYFASVGLQFQQLYGNLPRRVRGHGLGWLWVLAAPTIHLLRFGAFVLAGFFSRLDLRWKYTDKGYPKNYVVTARRRARGQDGQASEASA